MKIYTQILLSVLFMSLTLIGCATDNEQVTTVDQKSNELYTCGMHPNVVQEGSGTCPICGMYLTPLNDLADEHNDGSIKIDPATVQNIGVRTTKVERRDISKKIRVLGRVEFDESQSYNIQTKYSGWIEKIYFNKTGQRVSKGDILLEIYSPKLVSSQNEYLELLGRIEQSGADTNLKANLTATRERLKNFDISDEQIQKLERDGSVSRTIQVLSPFDGIINYKHAEVGMEVNPNMNLYSISNLEQIWVLADIYENDASLIKPGLAVELDFVNQSGKKLNGVVDYVYPYLNKKTRSLQIRIVIPNENQLLKPGMYANVFIETDPVNNTLTVPSEAVIYSGNDNLVFIDKGDGIFTPRDIEIGIESHDGYYEIIDGLEDGDVVVTSAQFLLDSESKLQKNISEMNSNSDHSHHNH